MIQLALAFSTKDRIELSQRTVEPLLHGNHALFWVDGSKTKEGEQLPYRYDKYCKEIISNVRGGADAAIVFSLTEMLNHPGMYTHVGLIENDVLIEEGSIDAAMNLFGIGAHDGLDVGAVSVRSFQDRMLFQREGYSVSHNSGAGMVILTREAARRILDNFRTAFTLDNRRIFAELSGLDIGNWWTFRNNVQFLTADWNFEAILAQYGLASLALTPNRCEMIGQVPPLAEQGLTYVTQPLEQLRNDDAFKLFVARMRKVREGSWSPGSNYFLRHQSDDRWWTLFPHQMQAMGGVYAGNWKLRWCQGFGPFAWEADVHREPPTLEVPVSGDFAVLVTGGKAGGKIRVTDTANDEFHLVDLPPEDPQTTVTQLNMSAGMVYRPIRIEAMSAGVSFFGLRTREPQPGFTDIHFDHSMLPPP